MKNKLEEAFAENNIDLDNKDYLLMALLKRMGVLLESNKNSFGLIMEKLKKLQPMDKLIEEIRPRMYPSPS